MLHLRDANKPMNLEIRFGVPENQRLRVAEIFYESFGDKFGKIFGNKNKGVTFVSRCLRDDRTLAAFKDGFVVGFAGLQYNKKSFIDANLHQTIKIFGLGIILTIGSLLFIPERPVYIGVLHCIGLSIILCIPFLKYRAFNLVFAILFIYLGIQIGQINIQNPSIIHFHANPVH